MLGTQRCRLTCLVCLSELNLVTVRLLSCVCLLNLRTGRKKTWHFLKRNTKRWKYNKKQKEGRKEGNEIENEERYFLPVAHLLLFFSSTLESLVAFLSLVWWWTIEGIVVPHKLKGAKSRRTELRRKRGKVSRRSLEWVCLWRRKREKRSKVRVACLTRLPRIFLSSVPFVLKLEAYFFTFPSLSFLVPKVREGPSYFLLSDSLTPDYDPVAAEVKAQNLHLLQRLIASKTRRFGLRVPRRLFFLLLLTPSNFLPTSMRQL